MLLTMQLISKIMQYDSVTGKLTYYNDYKYTVARQPLHWEKKQRNYDSMFPALIKHYDIDISTEAKYNDTTKEFKIVSVDWDNKIITTDKKVILPNIQNENNAQYWQIYIVGKTITALENIIQLTEQLTPNSFKFILVDSQTALSCIPDQILTAEVSTQGTGYTDGDILYLINPLQTTGRRQSYITLSVILNPVAAQWSVVGNLHTSTIINGNTMIIGLGDVNTMYQFLSDLTNAPNKSILIGINDLITLSNLSDAINLIPNPKGYVNDVADPNVSSIINNNNIVLTALVQGANSNNIGIETDSELIITQITIGNNDSISSVATIIDPIGNFTVNQIYATDYSSIIPPNPLEEGTGDNNLTIKILTTQNIFTTVGFRNPQQGWVPLNLTPISSGHVNTVCRYVSRYNNQFISLLVYNDGGPDLGFGKTTSNDFITWSSMTAISPISTGTLPTWMDDHSIIIPCMSSNNVVGNTHTLLFEQIGKGIGIATTTDFIHYTYSANKFTYAGTINGGTITLMSEGSYIKYNGVYYIGLTVQLSNDVRANPYIACIFTWSGNLNNMALTFVQALGLNRPNYCWNVGYTELPNIFEANGKLYCLCVGDDNGNNGEIGNITKTNGLYIFNNSTGLFEEYMSNPVILNVELDSDYSNYTQHQDGVVVYPYNSRFYSIICMNSGTNTYKVFPAQLCMKNKDMVDDWVNCNINLNS